MNKWFLRLFVALIAFTLSLVLTSVTKFLRGSDSPVELSVLEPWPLEDFVADKAQIADIYSEYGPAQTRHDRAFFERVEAENFTLFVGTRQLTREQDIQWMEQQSCDLIYEVRMHHLEVFGNSAVSRGHMLVQYSNGEKQAWPFIDVWVKRGSTWRIQSTTSSD